VSRPAEPTIERRAQARCSGPQPQAAARPTPACRDAGAAARSALVFVWESFAFHHLERCAACVAQFDGRFEVYGLEIATYDTNYQWRKGSDRDGLKKITLFPGEVRQEIGALRCAWRIVSSCVGVRARYVFLCNYESPAIFLAAIALRLLGRRIIVMQDSKFDDKQRRLGMELFKALLYSPYHAALAAGQRTRAYLRFLGFPEARIFLGYDTISVERVRRMAAIAPAPQGTAYAQRHFTVIARFIAKKNLALALDAYAAYRADSGDGCVPRALHLVGSGELEPALRQQARELGLDQVHFRGYLDEDEVARLLGSTLALILPSIEEQHGLVVNEALAMGVPVLLSDNCGARDLLVRSGVNGYVFEADNVLGLAHFMALLDRDEDEWTRLALGTRRFLPAADTKLFASAVEQALAGLG
jgi:glycosyltransferase involved in cell wall biosynthesis